MTDQFAGWDRDEHAHAKQLANANAVQRQHAEARLQRNIAFQPEEIAALSPEAARHLLHELAVHQIELEMQNEQLRESQVALDAARERYFDLYDLAPVGYCAVSEQGMVRQANLTAADLFGMVRSALLNQPFSQRILTEDQGIYFRYRRRLLSDGEPQSFELRAAKNNGTSFWVHLTMTLGHDADGIMELRVVLIDVSDRKEVESERESLQRILQEKNLELERARIVADKANHAKSDFLSSMSHELRTPLHAILGFGQLITNGSPAPTPEQKQSLDHILKAGWHLLELINEILDLAIIEAGKPELLMEPVSLSELIFECKAMVEPAAALRGIDIVMPGGEIPYFVQADPLRIKQILINLLSNAIKYNKKSGRVTVDCFARSGGRIRIQVQDTGAGLTQDKLAQLFQPFNRLGQEAGVEEGTGIGLVVCKRLIELMGGTIGVETSVGKGCTFWIELDPIAMPQTTAHADRLAAQTTIQMHDQPEAQGYTLLYVEDNLANLMLVKAIIARQPNIRLLTAPNGTNGISMARQFLPDIILMDIDLPDISGIEAMKMLAQDSATAHIPVVALSANAMLGDIEKGMKAGFFHYLTKPIKIDQLMQTLKVDFKLPPAS